jgi:hypothetical protein
VVISESGLLSEHHDEPVAYCSAIRHHLESLTDHDQLQLFWDDNAATIEDLRQALPALQTEGGQHYADVLGNIFAARLQSLTDDDEVLESSTDEPSNGATDETSGETPESHAVAPISVPRRHRDKPHLEFVASEPCLICDRTPCEAHHIRFAQPRAMGMKVSDEWTVPLCATHHRLLHGAGNEKDWWASQKVDPIVTAERLWHASHGRQAAE